MTDAKLPERAAVALYEILEAFAPVAHSAEAMREFMASEKSQREIILQLLAFFGSLVARPGRPRVDKYRRAAAFRVQNGKTTNHTLCVRFEPEYASMSGPDQRKARDRMRVGVDRLLKATVQARTKSPM
jgi:hypothetical protein